MMFLRIAGKFLGVHRWKDAPEEYAYLAQYHPHTFHFEALIMVSTDREVEFLGVATWCEHDLRTFLRDHMDSSCETLAAVLHDILARQYGPRVWSTVVLEDGMCGAVFVPAFGHPKDEEEPCSQG